MTSPRDTTLASIAGLRDSVGVLSVYVDADPSQEASQRPSWVVATRSSLHELVEQAKADGDRERRYALEGCFERIEPRLAELLDARESGRGRALFARLAAQDDVETVSLQLPLPNAVRLNDRAYLRPLVEALDRGRAAGIVAVSKGAIRVIEQKLGSAEELLAYDVAVETDTWRELRGPTAANPMRGRQMVSHRDRFERRVEEHEKRELHGVAHAIASVAQDRGWDRIVVSGDPHLRAPVIEAVSVGEREVAAADRDVAGIGLPDISHAVAGDLAAATAACDLALVERATNAAYAGGHGAIGADDVLGALGEGRVQRLLLDSRFELLGSVDENGAVVADGTTDLVEVMIDRAIETDAAITLPRGPAADTLASAGGVAAILRW